MNVAVIARNPKSLSALSAGKASYGARSILDQAEDYLECAQLYPCMYQPPKACTFICIEALLHLFIALHCIVLYLGSILSIVLWMF